MCEIMDEIREEGREEGRQEGREEGIVAMVNTLKELKLVSDVIIEQIMKQFNLSKEEAGMFL